MPASTTKIGIINRGLQLLGQPSISSLNENSRSARSMIRAYDSIFLAEVEANTWNFTIRRASLAADPTPPIFGKPRYYPLPGDFLYLAPEETTYYNPSRRDYQIEVFNNQLCIVSQETEPLPIRYVSSNITESLFSATFAEVMAYALAAATCEEITNSNAKLQNLSFGYKESVRRAKRRNDMQNAPVKSPTCTTILVRD
jgi:hypothetical protein